MQGSGARKTKLETGKSSLAKGAPLRIASRRFQSLPASEIRFLAYRLEVARSWPESARKQVTIQAILFRLRGATLPPND